MGSFFLVFLTKCLLKCPSSMKPPLPFLVVCLHSGIILFAKESILCVLQCSEYTSVDHCSVICTVTFCYVLHRTQSRHIQAYSGILSTLCNPCIFTTLSYSDSWHLEPEAYSKPREALTRHVQNLAIFRTGYPSIIQSYLGIFRGWSRKIIWAAVAAQIYS